MKRFTLGLLLIALFVFASCGSGNDEENYDLDYIEEQPVTTPVPVRGAPPGAVVVDNRIDIANPMPQPPEDWTVDMRQNSISAGGNRSAVVMADGTVYTWGGFPSLSWYRYAMGFDASIFDEFAQRDANGVWIGSAEELSESFALAHAEALERYGYRLGSMQIAQGVAAVHLGGELLITDEGRLLHGDDIITEGVADLNRGVNFAESYIVRNDGRFEIFDRIDGTLSPYHLFEFHSVLDPSRVSEYRLDMGRGMAAVGNMARILIMGIFPAQFRVMATGNNFVLTYNGQLWAWGDGDAPLGHAATGREATPVLVMEDVAKIAASASFVMALTNDDRLYIWGRENMGLGNISRQSNPAILMENVAYMTAGTNHSMILTRDGQLWGFGANNYGQLGDGTSQERDRPVMIMQNVAAVSAGVNHTLVVTNDGRLWSWGDNSSGQLGDGTLESTSTPMYILSGVRLP